MNFPVICVICHKAYTDLRFNNLNGYHSNEQFTAPVPKGPKHQMYVYKYVYSVLVTDRLILILV